VIGDGRVDYSGRVLWDGNELSLWISGRGSNFEPLPVRRLNTRTVEFIVPGGAPMNPTGIPIGLAATSSCADGARIWTDRIPDRGWLRVVAFNR
jgi:hypothetical protein